MIKHADCCGNESFYINQIHLHQIKGTTIGAKFTVIGSNLIVAYEENKMFSLLPQIKRKSFPKSNIII